MVSKPLGATYQEFWAYNPIEQQSKKLARKSFSFIVCYLKIKMMNEHHLSKIVFSAIRLALNNSDEYYLRKFRKGLVFEKDK
ncbi:hypothetical protein GCM10023331_01690 [Algivirga pacifica]|uniref:Uncharacterized protein n=1 Tax=Algivirga pacifica TaxID=1162670 RepID=A0ABP9CXU4_9BACT